jgi:acetolactate synthase I/II/III large subunit
VALQDPTASATRTVEAALADEIYALCQGVLFGLIGDDTARLVARLAAMPGLEYYGARHEAAAVSMADGYARATGRLAVCVVSRGPGFSNALTGLAAAQKAGSPVLVLVGDTSEAEGGIARLHPKHIDQAGLTHACGAAELRISEAHEALEVLQGAAAIAAAGRVAVVNIATDVFTQQIDGKAARPTVVAQAAQPRPTAPAEVAALADALAASRRPVLLAGRGAVCADAKDDLIELSEQSGALLGTTLRAKDLFVGHARDIGVVGGFAHHLAREILAQADCVIAFGASLNAFTTGGGKLFADAKLFQVDRDVSASDSASDAAVAVRGDARVVARSLRAELANRPNASAGWSAATIEHVAGYDPGRDIDDRSTDEALDPRTLFATLEQALPRDRAVVLDAGHFTGYAARFLSTPGPRHFTACLDYAAVGVSHGTALGVAIADRSRRTVLVIGDGGLLMSLGELDTAGRYRLPLVIVVVNDAAYGAELHYLVLHGVATAADTTVFEERDFAQVAAPFGFESCVVRTVADARAAARFIERAQGPVLIDCRVVRDVRARWLEELFDESGGTFGR